MESLTNKKAQGRASQNLLSPHVLPRLRNKKSKHKEMNEEKKAHFKKRRVSLRQQFEVHRD